MIEIVRYEKLYWIFESIICVAVFVGSVVIGAEAWILRVSVSADGIDALFLLRRRTLKFLNGKAI